MALEKSGPRKYFQQDLCNSEPIKTFPIQSPEPAGDNEMAFEWSLDPMKAPNPDVAETLHRIAGIMASEDRSRAPEQTRNISLSPLCDFCNHVFTHLKPDPPREDAPRYMGGLWTPDGKVQSTADFEHSAMEITCSFCRLLWNQLDPREREEPMKDIGEDNIALSPSNVPLLLRVRYPFSEASKFLYLAPCNSEVYRLTKELTLG